MTFLPAPAVHVACAANGAYVPHIATLLQSLAAHHGGTGVTVHFLHDASVTATQLAQLRGQVEKTGMQLACHLPSDAQLQGLPVTERYPQVVWFRVLLPDLLPDVDRVLYLDADTLVLQSLLPLWQLDLSGLPFAAVQDVISPAHAHVPAQIGLKHADEYFNSGVMLMNLDEMRSSNFHARMQALDRKRFVAGFPDQIALNAVAMGRWLRLHPKWNCMTPFIAGTERSSDLPSLSVQQREAGASPCVVHFEGYWQRAKPWQYRCDHPYQWVYLHYRNLTPWPLAELEGRTLKARILKRVPRSLLDFFWRLRG
ncbi:MAG: glycosyltransferase family 8 protein [Rhizobium sp.]|nr:MAG: glycosyltransferase family 8 protein [Rhizobium sp.]